MALEPERPFDSASCRASVSVTCSRDYHEDEEEAEEDGGYRSDACSSAAHSFPQTTSTFASARRSSAPALTTSGGEHDRARVERVCIPLPDGLAVPGVLYAPTSSAPSAVVIASPGSNGGTGPGIEASKAGLPLKRCHSSAAYGSIYWRLGLDLSTGQEHDWRGTAVGPPCGRESQVNGRGNVAVLQISWRRTSDGSRWPGKKLKTVASLRDASEDFQAAAHWLLERFPGAPPIFMVGFSFGGPAAWAAAARLVEKGLPIRGVVALAGSGRGGSAFESEGMDTAGCIRQCARAGVRALFLHGTEDQNVALEFASLSFQTASMAHADAKVALVVMDGATHMLDTVRGAAYALLRVWLLSAVKEALQQKSSKTMRRSSRSSLSSRRPDDGSLHDQGPGPGLGPGAARGRSSSLCSSEGSIGSIGSIGSFASGSSSRSKWRATAWEASATWLPSIASASGSASAAVLVSGSTSSTIRSTIYQVAPITAEALLEQGAKGYSEKQLSEPTMSGDGA